jgi:hypothetical protein
MTGYGDSQRIETELSALFGNVGSAQEELQASLARYACVLASSYLEAAFREMVLMFARAQASPSVVRYVDSTLSAFRDPNTEKILQLLGRLGSKYREGLEAEISGKLKDSVDSISANRNNIAHGRRSGISVAQVQSYYNDARVLVLKARAIVTS